MFEWIKNYFRADEDGDDVEKVFEMHFFRSEHEDDALHFEYFCKRKDIKKVADLLVIFLDFLKVDDCNDWHYWIDNFVKTNKDTWFNFDEVKRLNKEFYEYMKEHGNE